MKRNTMNQRSKGTRKMIWIAFIMVVALQAGTLARAAENEVEFGIDLRSVESTMYRYVPYEGTRHSWNEVDLTGIRVGYLRRWEFKDQFSFAAGAGLSLFFSGDYKLDAPADDRSGDTSFSYEASIPAEFGYHPLESWSFYAQLGVAHMALSMDGADGASAFDEALTDLFLAVGARYDLNDKWTVYGQYRRDVADLGGSSDLNDFDYDCSDNAGFQLGASLRF